MKFQEADSMKVDQEEIEKIFGKPRENTLLFEKEEYELLREQILKASSFTYTKAKLPFGNCLERERLKLLSEILFMLLYSKRADESIKVRHAENERPIEEKSALKCFTDKYVFTIDAPGICLAYGYYNAEKNRFYIMKGSRFSKKHIEKYSAASSAATRMLLIRKACVELEDSYEVIADFGCRTASSAASVVMGRVSHYVYWKDSEGRLLADIYPDKFTSRSVSAKVLKMNKSL